MAEVIVALDQETPEAALAVVDQLPGLRWAKVGATLFVAGGPALVRELRAREVRVFLDLKWHDIPRQVAGAVRAAGGMGAALVTVHALGGARMLAAAAAAAADGLAVVAVTVLTSHTAEDFGAAVGSGQRPLPEHVQRLSAAAATAGLDGVVTSPREVSAAARALGAGGLIVVPGIRPPGAAPDDQRRTATAAEAVAAGATHLVVGRPITRSEAPARVYAQLCEEAT